MKCAFLSISFSDSCESGVDEERQLEEACSSHVQ